MRYDERFPPPPSLSLSLSYRFPSLFLLLLARTPLHQPPNQQDSDILASLPAFRSFNRNGVDATLTCAKSEQLPKALAEELFAICKQNMQKAYDSAWGWSDGAKRAELTHDAARFILVSEKKREAAAGAGVDAAAAANINDDDDNNNNNNNNNDDDLTLSALACSPSDVLAYVHFRFETDEETQNPILYVYEVQLRDDPKTRRKGLGRFLMQLLELSARKTGGLQAITLTVQDTNHAAAALYASLGYARDVGSPCPLEEPEAGYTILTKPLPPPKQPLAVAGGNGRSTAAATPATAASSKAVVAA